MDTSTTSVRKGMDVLCKDGQKLGSIAAVHSETHPTGHIRAGETDVTESSLRMRADDQMIEGVPLPDMIGGMGASGAKDGSPSADTDRIEGIDSGSGYLEVEEGGLVGFGAHHLYVPYAAVLSIVPGQSVLVDCHVDECLERFGEKPGWLGDG